jgi:small subunit ribosomal protein S9
MAKTEEQYYEAVGRRKTAVARIRIVESKDSNFIVNEKSLQEYAQTKDYQAVAQEAFEKSGSSGTFSVSALVKGGGPHAQVVAIRQGIARALVKYNGDLRTSLKTVGFLTRDPRMRERKKFGLKRARRARQWRKR